MKLRNYKKAKPQHQIIIEEDREDDEELETRQINFAKMRAFDEARKQLRHVSQTDLNQQEKSY